MTDAQLIATLAKLLREAVNLGPVRAKCLGNEFPLPPRWTKEARDILDEVGTRTTKPDPHEPGAFW